MCEGCAGGLFVRWLYDRVSVCMASGHRGILELSSSFLRMLGVVFVFGMALC